MESEPVTDETAIPTLPARDIDQSIAFYRQCGFTLVGRAPAPDDYAMLRRGDIEIHLFGAPELDPATCYGGCYVRVTDADALHAEFAKLGFPTEGIPRVGPPADQPWGMREFHVVDPSGNLLRIGSFLEADD